MQHTTKEYRVKTRRATSQPMTLPHAEALAQAIKREKRGPITILREGGSQDFHPHPENKGQFFLFRIVR